MKALPKFTTLSILLFISTFTGCGSLNPVNAPAVHAAAPTDPSCSGLACAGQVTHSWGYCAFETHQSENGKTFTASLEIGINTNQTDPNDVYCFLPLALSGGNLTSIHGTVNYLPWTTNPSSMVAWINANKFGGGTDEYQLFTEKIATVNRMPSFLPINGTFPALPVWRFVVAFNDDLATAKPTTINIAFSGTFQ